MIASSDSCSVKREWNQYGGANFFEGESYLIEMFYLQWATIAEPSIHRKIDALSTVSLKGKAYNCFASNTSSKIYNSNF